MPEHVAHQQITIVEDSVRADVIDLANNNGLATVILDGSGNPVTSFGGSGGTSATDDAAFTAASGSGTPVMGFVTSDSVDSGDVGVLGMLANRQLKVTLFDSSGNAVANLRDFDTGAGTDNVPLVGIALPASGGAVAGGTATNPLNIRIVDGDSSVIADVLDLTNSNPQVVAIVDSNGDQITSFGGGVQYTEGDTDSTITGTAILWEDTSDTLRAVSAAKPLPVAVISSALPSGAATSAKQDTQITAEQAIQVSVELIDDAIKQDDNAFTPATTKVMMAGFEFDDSSPDSVDEGDAGAARMSSRREQYVQIRDAAGNERGLNIDASGQLAITVASIPSHAVTNAGTFAVQATAVGTIAHDGGASAVVPLLTGGYANAAAPTDVSADLDAVRAWYLRNGAAATVITAAGALIGGDATNGLDVDVTRLPALVAGSALVGKVGIDQTTPGTTESVTVKSKTVYQRVVYGTAQTVFNSSTDIAAANFSAGGTDFTNNDGTIGACLYADAMIEMPDWAAAPVAGTVVSLWGLPINVDGTDDDTDAPSGTAAGGAKFLGSWVIAAADALQRRTITISLAGIQNGFTPYILNGTAQNMNNDGGTNMVVKITPWTIAMVG